MKITKQQLKQIIKEELEIALIKENISSHYPQLTQSLMAVTSQEGHRAEVLAAFSLAFDELVTGLTATAKAYGLDQGGQDDDSKGYKALLQKVQDVLSQLQRQGN